MAIKKILIIGAGISGLSLAINLKKMNIPYRIVEKQAQWSKKGLAMSIQGEGLEAASSLGILEKIKTPGKMRNLEIIEDSKGRVLRKLLPDFSDQGFVIRRDVLHEALRTGVPNIEMGLFVTHIKEQKDSIEVTFSDASTDSFNLVVGADGINSRTLSFVSGKSEVGTSGFVLWGIEVKKKYDKIIEVWDNKGMCTLYPVKEGTVFSFFRKAPKTFQSKRSERASHIKKYFSSYPQTEIKEVLENLPQDIFFDHLRYTRPVKWNRGLVTLIGDACHSLSPLSGSGANIAMADAMGLAQVIQKYGKNDNFLETLEKYNSLRKKEADKAYFLSKQRTSRGMMAFPETILRNIKMKRSGWTY